MLAKIVVFVLVFSVGGLVYNLCERKNYTLIILAKSLEVGTGRILIEPVGTGKSISKSFQIKDATGNQSIYVVELPAMSVKSLQVLPVANVGSYAVDRIMLTGDEISYRWDSDGVCTQKLRRTVSQPEDVCSGEFPELSVKSDGSIVITSITERGMFRSKSERGGLAAISALLFALAVFWLKAALPSGQGCEWRRLFCSRVLWLTVFALIGYQFSLIYRYSVDVPYFDEWVYFKSGALINGLNLKWLFSFHFEHRIVFTYLLAWLNLKLFHLNFVVQTIFNFFIFIGLLLLFYQFLRKYFTKEGSLFLPAFMIFLLSPLNWENHIWGFQSQIHLGLLFSIIALQFAFDLKKLLRATFIFTVFTLFAIYSFSSGLVLALVCLIIRSIYLGISIKDKLIGSVAGYISIATGWVLVGVGVGFWFKGYFEPGRGALLKIMGEPGNYYYGYLDPGTLPLTLPSQKEFWVFFMNVLSLGFGFESENVVPGVVILFITIAPTIMLLTDCKRRSEAYTWQLIAIITFLILTLAAISMGRAGYSLSKHSRYAEFGMFLIPAVSAAWWVVLRSARGKILFLSVFWIACFVSFADHWSADKYLEMKQIKLSMKDSIENYYRGVGDGYFMEANPEALDNARKLGVSFTKSVVWSGVIGK